MVSVKYFQEHIQIHSLGIGKREGKKIPIEIIKAMEILHPSFFAFPMKGVRIFSCSLCIYAKVHVKSQKILGFSLTFVGDMMDHLAPVNERSDLEPDLDTHTQVAREGSTAQCSSMHI